jgi:hypothetical protein
VKGRPELIDHILVSELFVRKVDVNSVAPWPLAPPATLARKLVTLEALGGWPGPFGCAIELVSTGMLSPESG